MRTNVEKNVRAWKERIQKDQKNDNYDSVASKG